MTIPSNIRKKYHLRKGTRFRFVETDDGVLIVPLDELYGADRDQHERVYRMIAELQKERRREASEG